MVKLLTSSIGWLMKKEEGEDKSGEFDVVYLSVCKSYTLTLSFSAGHHPSISHIPLESSEDFRQTPVITPGHKKNIERLNVLMRK